MEKPNLVVNVLLAFLQQKLDVMDEVSAVQICKSNFSEDEIVAAKKLLYESLGKSDEMVSRRRDGTPKSIQDIITLLKVTDPDDVPTFLVKDLHKLPPVTFDHVDVTSLLKDIVFLKASLAEVLCKLQASQDYGVLTLELVELRVPAHVPLGTRAQLSCRWQLGPADVLYSVKWYKDGKEFFRHVPRDVETRRKFPLPGVDVEKSSPNGANVTLSPAVLETGGRYRCEVSGERPLFPTVSDHSDMIIVALPDRGPTISGSRLRYQIGDRVHVNCTSGRSRPSTRLAWYINGEPAPAGAVLPPSFEKHEDGLETTSLALDFKVKQKHFKKGDLKLKCLATIATVYWRSNEESVQGDRGKSYGRSRDYTEGASRADRVQAAGRPGAAPALAPALAAAVVLPMLLVTFNT